MAQAYEQANGSPAPHETPGSEKSRADSAQEALLKALQAGEETYVFVECLRRQKLKTFERAVVALTDRRLLVIGPVFPRGFDVREAHPLADCTVVNGKERIDGSRLMVLRHDRGTLCLYFGRSHREEADAILNAVGFQPTVEAVPDVSSELQPPPPRSDPLVGVQQFSELLRSLELDHEKQDLA